MEYRVYVGRYPPGRKTGRQRYTIAYTLTTALEAAATATLFDAAGKATVVEDGTPVYRLTKLDGRD